MADLATTLNALGTDFFKALSDPSRVQILLTLAAAGQACTVSRIAESAAVDLSVVSRHLRQLKEAQLVDAEKHGREVYYSLACARVAGLLRQCADALEQCCVRPGVGCC